MNMIVAFSAMILSGIALAVSYNNIGMLVPVAILAAFWAALEMRSGVG
jgi:hypothetical protein